MKKRERDRRAIQRKRLPNDYRLRLTQGAQEVYNESQAMDRQQSVRTQHTALSPLSPLSHVTTASSRHAELVLVNNIQQPRSVVVTTGKGHHRSETVSTVDEGAASVASLIDNDIRHS